MIMLTDSQLPLYGEEPAESTSTLHQAVAGPRRRRAPRKRSRRLTVFLALAAAMLMLAAVGSLWVPTRGHG